MMVFSAISRAARGELRQCVRATQRRGDAVSDLGGHAQLFGWLVPPQVRLRAPLDGSLPSDKEKVATTKRAPVGLKEPVECSLNGISDAHTPKLDRSAMWAARGEQPYCGEEHDPKRRLSPYCLRQGRRHFGLTA
jgi:hypothetical protein